jgi:hypothetical protein
MHTIRGLVFVQYLIVFAECNTKYDGGHVLETVDPLFALGTLASYVKETKVEVLEREVDLDDTFF